MKDDERPGTSVSADYRYKETPGAGGEFDFGLDKNFDSGCGPLEASSS